MPSAVASSIPISSSINMLMLGVAFAISEVFNDFFLEIRFLILTGHKLIFVECPIRTEISVQIRYR